MKIFLSLLFTGAIWTAQAQSSPLLGAWERQGGNSNHQVLVLTDGYWSFTEYNVNQKNFVGTMGGSWSREDSKLSFVYEFSTFAEVLHSQLLPANITELGPDQLKLGNTQWKRLDAGSPGRLQGAWLITGRERDGDLTAMTPGARKTMKILSGTRFQWIAYNTETREFMGTGGGTYTTKDGRYTEYIDFFSRDNSRVGADLSFDFELKGDQWHHRGNSSKGDPIYEVWSLRSSLE